MRALAPTSLPWARPRHELLLLALVGVVALLPVYRLGDQDLSRLCLAQALVHGHLSSDECLAPSFDRATYGGRLYSDKAPGLAFAAVPAAEAVRLPPVERIEGSDARLWAVRVLTSGLAFLLAAFLVGRTAEGLAPGRGGAALVAFALGTIVAPLAATSFAHVTAAALGFAAFLLAWRRRPLAAGLVAGAALLAEYQTAAIAVAVGLYAVLRGLRAGALYVVGLVPGIAALLVYDALAFGSPWHLSYRYVAIAQQQNGLFGIGVPHLHSTWEVFAGSSGLLLVSPVLLAAGYGLAVLARARPAEALVAACVTVFFLALACSYFVPYGGTKLGPRFVVPALPFLALGLGPAFSRHPRITAALTVLSVLPVLGLTLVWGPNPPLHQTIWGELARVPVDGSDSRLMRHMTPNALGLTSAGSGWGLGLMVAAAAAALAIALVPRWPRWAVAAAAAGVAVLVVGAERLPAKPPDLRASITGSTAAALPGDEVDLVFTLANQTAAFVPHAVLMIDLPRGMELLGRPTYEHGKGCSGSSMLDCDLASLDSYMVTRIHLGVRIARDAPAMLALRAWPVAGDAVGPVVGFSVATGAA